MVGRIEDFFLVKMVDFEVLVLEIVIPWLLSFRMKTFEVSPALQPTLR